MLYNTPVVNGGYVMISDKLTGIFYSIARKFQTAHYSLRCFRTALFVPREMPVTLLVYAAACRLFNIVEEKRQTYILFRSGILHSVSRVLPDIINVVSASLVKAYALGKLGDYRAEHIIKFYHKVTGSCTHNEFCKLICNTLCRNIL